MRVVKEIYKIQPVQIDTVELVPMSSIDGIIGEVKNVVGSTLAAKVTVTHNMMPLVDGTFDIIVTDAAAGKFGIVNTAIGMESEEYSVGTDISSFIPGATINVSDLTGEVDGNKVTFATEGNQTYIIPGTIVGKIKIGEKKGLWRPVKFSDEGKLDDLYSAFRICSTFQETDKSKTTIPASYESNLSTVYTIDVIVYGQVYESACNAINLGVPGLKEKLQFIAWL